MDGVVYILYHCNDTERCRRFINEPNFLIESKEDGIWLGSGMYFWDNISNAHYWESQKKKRIADVSMVAAKVSGDHLLDLTDSETCEKIQMMYSRIYRNRSFRNAVPLGKKLNFLYDNVVWFRENYNLMRIYGKYLRTPSNSLFSYDMGDFLRIEPTLAVKCIYNVKNPKCILQKEFAEEELL